MTYYIALRASHGQDTTWIWRRTCRYICVCTRCCCLYLWSRCCVPRHIASQSSQYESLEGQAAAAAITCAADVSCHCMTRNFCSMPRKFWLRQALQHSAACHGMPRKFETGNLNIVLKNDFANKFTHSIHTPITGKEAENNIRLKSKSIEDVVNTKLLY